MTRRGKLLGLRNKKGTGAATPRSLPTARDPALMPLPPAEPEKKPLWRRPWFIPFAASAFLVAAPVVAGAFNLLRADEPAPVITRAPVDLDLDAEASLGVFARKLATVRAAHPEFTDAVAHGMTFDPALTPAFLDLIGRDTAPPLVRPGALIAAPAAREALVAMDGVLRAALAETRAATPSDESAVRLRALHARRVRLVGLILDGETSVPGLLDALRDQLAVYAELRADQPLAARALDRDPALLRDLAAAALPSPAAPAIATRLDATLDEFPDDGLELMRADESGRPRTLFRRLVALGRRPNAHRRKVAELHRDLGAALAKPVLADAIACFPQPWEIAETSRLATIFLRDEVLETLGNDPATAYYFEPEPAPDSGMQTTLLKFGTLAKADDPYGQALLLHRRATLRRLVAIHARVRFEAAATAYALALEFRRTPDGKWPKDTQGLFAGLLDRYPLDPFTDEPVNYSRRKRLLTSPGADGVPAGGIDEPEFASDLAQLWEPTVPLESTGEQPTPGAFGVRPDYLEKPAPRPWERPLPVDALRRD